MLRAQLYLFFQEIFTNALALFIGGGIVVVAGAIIKLIKFCMDKRTYKKFNSMETSILICLYFFVSVFLAWRSEYLKLEGANSKLGDNAKKIENLNININSLNSKIKEITNQNSPIIKPFFLHKREDAEEMEAKLLNSGNTDLSSENSKVWLGIVKFNDKNHSKDRAFWLKSKHRSGIEKLNGFQFFNFKIKNIRREFFNNSTYAVIAIKSRDLKDGFWSTMFFRVSLNGGWISLAGYEGRVDERMDRVAPLIAKFKKIA